jgi:cell division protease FtsH
LAADVDMAVIARGTPGFSGADLENLVNEAALMAAREGGEEVAASHLERAKDKVMMGTERKSMIISDREKEITAYHEAGHALVARMLPGTDPIHKVTIIPRGRALGLTMQLPLDERYTHGRTFLLNTIAILFGGRVAEKLIFNEITTGAGNDIERASELARKMVCEWGMSDDLGPMAYGKKEEHIFLGREIAQHRDYSEQTARNIDSAIKQIIFEANEKVTNLLQENMAILKAVLPASCSKKKPSSWMTWIGLLPSIVVNRLSRARRRILGRRLQSLRQSKWWRKPRQQARRIQLKRLRLRNR